MLRHPFRTATALLTTIICTGLFILSPLQVQRVYATETHKIGENLATYVDDVPAGTIRTIHYDYAYNRYLSLRDLAVLLNGTSKSFGINYTDKTFHILPGETYAAVGGENEPFVLPAPVDASYAGDPADEDPEEGAATGGETQEEAPFEYVTQNMSSGNLFRNDAPLKYFSFTGDNAAGKPDVFVSITDLAMILDLQMYLQQDTLYIQTGESFRADLDAWAKEGLYQETYSALIGDATTGEIYQSHMADLSVPIASTSKLMTYLCVMDAVTEGAIGLDDPVFISEKAAALSQTGDGVIKMKPGDMATVEELLYGLLLPSSNESALALAEYVCGSEEAFVARMNETAQALGLTDATFFYNPNGLPIYANSVAATKMQNHMSARDMFTLVTHILSTYPQILRITSQKEARLDSFELTVKNSNPLLYNMDGVRGLKTGTTIMSGACLVSVLEAADPQGNPHLLVAMEFGGEDSTVRTTLSQLLLTYGKQRLNGETSEGSGTAPLSQIPANAEALIRAVIANMPD
ncbi:MAG: serine hydrolase [Lachnospiraceae bacterium]|nr:serine hydrolase [Lachnospiraceae bacterium]